MLREIAEHYIESIDKYTLSLYTYFDSHSAIFSIILEFSSLLLFAPIIAELVFLMTEEDGGRYGKCLRQMSSMTL